jgi:hypothetical protein
MVLAGKISVHPVIGAHHGAGLAGADGELKGQQIGLA